MHLHGWLAVNAMLSGFYLLMSLPLGALASWLFCCALDPIVDYGWERRVAQALMGSSATLAAGAGFAATVTAVLAWSL